jgi:S-adenosylmethionine hydrolase
VAPDNGVLTQVLQAVPSFTVHEITDSRFFRHPVSRTFHGRDILAPAAAHLGTGVPVSALGPSIDARREDVVRLSSGLPLETGPQTWLGSVLKVDHFGNLITNFKANAFPQVIENKFRITVGSGRAFQYHSHYSLAEKGQIFLTTGSSGYLEISQNKGHAAKTLEVSPGVSVELHIF